MKTFDVRVLKAAIRPRDFYTSELSLAPPRGGVWHDGGLCPFHNDKTSGSFRIHLETGQYRCFACGAKGGDIVAFVQARYGLSFGDAAKKLSHDWGV